MECFTNITVYELKIFYRNKDKQKPKGLRMFFCGSMQRLINKLCCYDMLMVELLLVLLGINPILDYLKYFKIDISIFYLYFEVVTFNTLKKILIKLWKSHNQNPQ